MASEVARFLRQSFLDSLAEAESELSGSVLLSYFTAIKHQLLKHKDIMFQPDRYSETTSLLHELNDALSEYRIFELECKQLNKKPLLFNPITYNFIRKMKNQLKAIKQDLASFMVVSERIGSAFDQQQEKSMSIDSSKVFGFDEQADHIEGLLFKEGHSYVRITSIGVVGIAGVGKTTLVQKVLERKRVIDGFKSIFWLSFSGMKGDQKQYSRLSVETRIADNLGNTVAGKMVGISELLEKLNQHLSGVRYLLVLDDMWGQHINIGKRLQRGLPKGSGGTVIFTTRLNEVAEKLVEQDKVVYVNPLDGESCWSIFQETMRNNGENFYSNDTLNKIEPEIKDQCHGLPLIAKALAKIIPEQIREIESERFFKEVYIPDELLRTDLDAEPAVYIPKFPVLVFIDMEKEQLGTRILNEFRYRLNKRQVHAVLGDNYDSKQRGEEENPEVVLRGFYDTLKELKQKQYIYASEIEKQMRIIIVGGDAVVNRILAVICDLKLREAPSIVPIQQGAENDIPVTENDIAVTFGWKPLKADRQSVTTFLKEGVTVAEKMKLDSWHLLMRMEIPKGDLLDPVAPLELPHSLHAFGRVSETNELNVDGFHTFRGGFWNHFSLGMDAEVSYAFHSERKLHPEKFKNQLVNQSTSAKLGSSQGWFSPSLSARNIAQFAKVTIMRNHGDLWEELFLPSDIKSIVCLNLPSFSGGFNPWGTPNRRKPNMMALRQFTQPFVDDGHIEVVGFTSAWRGQVLLAPKGSRLAQAHRIRFLFHKGATDQTYMEIDKEPWKQPLPSGDGVLLVEISHHCQVNILATNDCRCKSMHSTDNPLSDRAQEDEGDSDEENLEEEFRKFGAAHTFKVGEEIDISRLS